MNNKHKVDVISTFLIFSASVVISIAFLYAIGHYFIPNDRIYSRKDVSFQADISESLSMQCETVISNIRRCKNSEVVCYVALTEPFNGRVEYSVQRYRQVIDSMQCKFY